MDRQDWLRRLNYLGSAVGGASQLVSLDPDEMLECARSSTGLADFGDDGWREAYDVLVRSLARDVDLTSIGRLLTRSDILRALRNRLFVTQALKQTPEVRNERVVSPILIMGQGRSGTTILFELLNQDPDNRAPLGWEAASPIPPPGPSLADAITQSEIGQCDNELWDDLQPEMLAAHEHGWNLPVECIHFMAPDFSSDYWTALYTASGYLKWKFSKNPTTAYDWHENILKLLQHGQPPRRWLLKSAAHTRCLDVMLSHYPDLRIIQTHRDPAKTIPSTVSITGYLRWSRANDVDLLELGQLIHRSYQGLLRKVMRERADGSIPDGQIADLHFQDLMADPVASIRRLYETLGLAFSDEFAERIPAYLAGKPRGKFGTHRYSAEDYGLSQEQIRKDFRFYTDHYAVALED